MPASLGPSPWPDCGTLAASRRHYRRREPCCEPCRQANAREHAERNGHQAGAQSIDLRSVRNGLPEQTGYVYRAPRSPWVQAILARTGMRHQMPPVAVHYRWAPDPAGPFGQPRGYPACGRPAGVVLTSDPGEVTCGQCKRSGPYRQQCGEAVACA